MIVETSRCTGHCCKVFTLAFTPAELRQHARTARHLRIYGKMPGPASDAHRPRRLRDIEKVAAIAQWLGVRDGFHPLYNLSPFHKEWLEQNEDHALLKNMNHYTCRLLQPNGDCGDYDNRPTMCRTYPDDKPCEHAECTRKESSV